MAKLTPWLTQKFYAADGVTPLSGGKVFTYEENSTTKKASYTTQAGDVENTNPVILNANGEPSSGIWMDGDSYKFVVTTADDTDPPTSPISTYDYVNKPSDDFIYYIATYADLVAQLAAIGSDKATISIVGTITMLANVSIPNTIDLRIERDGYFQGANTLTINGTVSAGQWQVFDSASTIDIPQTGNTIEAMWFGGNTNQSTDGSTAVDAANTALSAGGTIHIPFGYKWEYDSITHGDYVIITDESGYENTYAGGSATWSNMLKSYIKEPDAAVGNNASGHWRFFDPYYPIIFIENNGSQAASEYPSGIYIGRRVAGVVKGFWRMEGKELSTADFYDMLFTIYAPTAGGSDGQYDFFVCRATDHIPSFENAFSGRAAGGAYTSNSGTVAVCLKLTNPYTTVSTAAALDFCCKDGADGTYDTTSYGQIRTALVGATHNAHAGDMYIAVAVGGQNRTAMKFQSNVGDNTHYVGINVDPPLQRLHIVGNFRVDNGDIYMTAAQTIGTLANVAFRLNDGTVDLVENMVVEDGVSIGMASGPLLTFNDAANTLVLSDGSLLFENSRYLQLGSSAIAATGQIRLQNGSSSQIVSRDNGDATDIVMIQTNASDSVELHDGDVEIKSSGLLNATKGFGGTPDLITADNAGTAASLETLVTEITTDGDSNEDNVTLANGYSGQVKKFAVSVVGNAADSLKITPTDMVGGSKISFGANPIGLGCEMVFTAAGWCVISNNGGTVS